MYSIKIDVALSDDALFMTVGSFPQYFPILIFLGNSCYWKLPPFKITFFCIQSGEKKKDDETVDSLGKEQEYFLIDYGTVVVRNYPAALVY